MKCLTHVLNYLNSITSINRGGCGIAALAIYRWLEKNNRLGDTKIVFLYDYSTYNLYRNNYDIVINRDNNVPEGAPHIIVERNKRYLDSTGFILKHNIHLRYGNRLKTDADFLLSAVNCHLDCWNQEFNRKLNINQIAKTLDIDLSDVKLSYLEYFGN